jgi:hypothetical protein
MKCKKQAYILGVGGRVYIPLAAEPVASNMCGEVAYVEHI